MTSEFSLQWTPVCGSSRKLVFEPQLDGEYAWARIEYELRESQWREIGVEYLEELSLVSDDGTGHTSSDIQTCLEGGAVDE